MLKHQIKFNLYVSVMDANKKLVMLTLKPYINNEEEANAEVLA